jgi:tRNA (mo5U34)-methyltransferase
MSVLDIGAWDGYYSFQAEARGAQRVLAIDVFQEGCSDRGFRLAKRVLHSKVEHRFHSVYDLDKLGERFDVILFLGVYYHLVDPIIALQRIFDALKDEGLLVLEGKFLPGSKPLLRALRPEEVEPTTYCCATAPWIQLVAKQIGYQNIELLSTGHISPLHPRGAARLLAWKLGLTFGPFFRFHHRALITMRRDLK